MIKFFRKIRQKLISENKFSKYLLYAIGEIILVVIGILIALQINNANEVAKQQKQQKIYETNLITELHSDLKTLDELDQFSAEIRFYYKLYPISGKPKFRRRCGRSKKGQYSI